MPIFKSSLPPIEVPSHLPIWKWLFDSEYSPLRRYKLEELGGYTNAITKEHLSYSDLRLHTIHLSTALVKRYGLQEGQTVSIFSPNTVWYPCVMFGTLRAGGIVSGASPAYNVEELAFALKTAEARFLFTAPSILPTAVAAARTVGIPQDHIFLIYGEAQNFTTLNELLEIGRSYDTWGQVEQFRVPPNKQNKDICAFLSFSSGTTGLPKAVMVAHSNIIAQCLQVSQMTPGSLRRILAVLPLFHITGLVHHLHLPFLLNANVYLLPSFTMESTLQSIQDYQLEEVLLVPPILIRMVRDTTLLQRYNLTSLRRLMSGAAPLSAEILALLQQHFPNTGFKQGYGMTESCSCITLHPPDKYDYKYATRVGTIVPSTEIKLVDPQKGTECGINEPGEIWARGPQVVMGYLNNKKATEETFDKDGFLHTGDIGSIDEEGMVTITDRLKEMIKVNGIGVAPAELEDLLLGHEDVEDVAVLGVKDDYVGERPKAYVVAKPLMQKHESLDALRKRLFQYVQERKARYKWITEIEFTDEIPKSASGKILRRVLRDTMSRRGSGLRSQGSPRATKM
ncbi:uncharacterized protein Z520_07200 [Fonsecaea multimorphosa CBS 102226]|uniref:Acetyl-CoA synthetase-like protein n=1 Tax=Fonsecaea multimorphosa CBS 102226 TaxID=1442371 RepID=A0A0D2IJ61_9EURO|nr:uncharacterized protein Z520_07200 [Fonsecaea multimorphosa CBS 102226]KIX97086.1 hypothetical protein Z520_07200 [Fonsecaea multimorphosa CBS 102226]OAL22862.1 hypothetical protein AYO22_06770 [Fonsecaea multimorphosa]